jgi:hypothetical protein
VADQVGEAEQRQLFALFQQARSNSAADFRAFYPLSQPEDGFRQNV